MKLIRSLLYLALLGLFSYYTGEALPRTWIRENACLFRPKRWEQEGAFYEKFKIKKWKLKLIDMSKIMKNSKIRKEIRGEIQSSKMTVLIKETCVAELSHWFLCISSVFVCNFWDNWIGGMIWLLYVIGNLPFIMIQRYNRPNLQRLRNKMTMREQRFNERGISFD
ncbi:MAG: hypothetical protein E7399_07255 [Ruminococcaceae bacterium]|nr:hypothetical protein [Oscillospiraceae bacterium]